MSWRYFLKMMGKKMIKKIDTHKVNELIAQAKASPRLRAHYVLHDDNNEPVQRFIVALQRGTFVKPHKHKQPNKWELLNVIEGSLALLIFDDAGFLLEKHLLGPNESNFMIEMPANTWHMIYPVTEHAVLFELKEGPYIAAVPEDFVAWAPNEGDADVPEFLAKIQALAVGERLAD